MAYRIVEHTQTGPNTRRLKVLVNPDEQDEAKQVHESFDWGLDVPEEQALAETRLLLDAKYAAPVDLGKLGEL